MKFNPPAIEHISQLFPHLKDNDNFIIVEKDWYKVVRYVVNDPSSFTNPYLRECRGIKFDSKTGRIIARPLHKFHNLNECEGYMDADIDLNSPNFVMEKLDGSMVHTANSSLGLYLMTKGGITDVSMMADKFLMKNQLRYSRFFDSLGWDDYTYIFEYTGPENQIVTKYEEENLTLIAIRHTVNGTYVFYDEMEKLANYYGIPIAKIYDPVLDKEKVKNDKENEGVVVRFDTGFMFKVKADAYLAKHRTIDTCYRHHHFMNAWANGLVDDMMPTLPSHLFEKIEAYNKELTHWIGDITTNILNHKEKYIQECEVRDSSPNPADYYSLVMGHVGCDKSLATIFMKCFRGEITDALGVHKYMTHIIKTYNTGMKQMKEFSEKWQMPTWG